MPTLHLSDLNVVLAVLGAFMTLYGVISVKLKQQWYLGEARKLCSFLFDTRSLTWCDL
jgi:hypothetical protein